LFSNDEVADDVNKVFEPVWESVRPVPIVRIDFGNGTVLTRTLHGNILTAVCNADGQVLDALPGIYDPAAYRERLTQLALLARYVQARPAGQQAARMRAYHQTQAAALRRGQTPEQFVVRARLGAPISKQAIERPVEVVLAPPAPRKEATAAVQRPEVGPRQEERDDVAHWKALAEDTQLNESVRRLQIHDILGAAGMVRPEKVTHPIYKDVLHADLDDPYLGLGKTLFATYPFGREDGAE
jgi:hypothetical protein